MNIDELKTKEGLVKALKAEDFSPYTSLADKIRKDHKGDQVFIRAIIEYSSICVQDCNYCGLRTSNADAQRYRMTKEEVCRTAEKAVEAGYRTIVLQGGEDPVFLRQGILEETIKRVKAKDPEVAITISAGQLTETELKRLRELGADRYLMKHETADPNLYSQLHPGMGVGDRIEGLWQIKKQGFETGSGFMVGLPGQTLEIIAQDLLLLKKLACDMAGIGPFIPHPKTPLANEKAGSLELTKRCLALARILLPDANLPVTTALGVLSQEAMKEAFSCGANVIMHKVNDEEYRRAYELYPGKIQVTSIEDERRQVEDLIKSLGRIPV